MDVRTADAVCPAVETLILRKGLSFPNAPHKASQNLYNNPNRTMPYVEGIYFAVRLMGMRISQNVGSECINLSPKIITMQK